jgi:hypothetical protein
MTRKRRSIGINPLDASPVTAAPLGATEANDTSTKAPFSVQLPTDLVEESRDAAWALRMTLASLAETGLRAVIDDLKRKHNKGKPFPRRGTEKLPAGRRIRST